MVICGPMFQWEALNFVACNVIMFTSLFVVLSTVRPLYNSMSEALELRSSRIFLAFELTHEIYGQIEARRR